MEATACHGTSIGRKAAVQATKGLAIMPVDLLTDGHLHTAARADFDARMEGNSYVSPIPVEIKMPPIMPQTVE